MTDLRRYTFRFDRDTEVHYLAHTPEVGDRVTHGRELWVVSELRADLVGHVVVCARSERRGGNGGAVEAHAARR